jgi:sugar phosphate isomerase/epimerase
VNGISTGAFEPERDTWSLAVQRAREEGWQCVELCAILPPLLTSLAEFLAVGQDLSAFTRVSLHAPVGIASPSEAIDAVLRLPLDGCVILHPDIYGADDAVAALGERAVFENMDVAKHFGQTVEDLGLVLDRFPEAGFCLDVAHVWTNDQSLDLGHALIQAFGTRLRQLHVSGIERDGTHRATTRDDLSIYPPLLESCSHVPHVYETVLV